MKHLIIIRHAKSSWDFPVEDKKRPLTKSGINAIQKVAKAAQNLVSTDFTVWSSTAVRATDTAILFCKETNLEASKIQFKDSLYTFEEQQLEKCIKTCDDSIQKLILFGHNEAITNFVNKFGDIYIDNVPTSGLVALQFDSDDWENLSKGKTITTLFPSQFKND